MHLSHGVVGEQCVDAEHQISLEEERFPGLNGLTFETGTGVGDDGRINFDVNCHEKRLPRLLQQILKHDTTSDEESFLPPYEACSAENAGPPTLNIVIQVIGSRGDIQPFVVLGLELQKYKHRVRVATHPVFQKFVERAGLEFFSIGGDPADLMSYMVRNPGLLPSVHSIVRGEIQQKRRTVLEMMQGCWRSCIEAGNGLPTPVPGSKRSSSEGSEVFIADAIIANPPSFAHIHCAEKLGIPMHIMFTMPWTPTREYAHPLVNMKPSGENVGLMNYLSFALVEVMVWQGLGGVVNQFRRKALSLEPIDLTWAPGLITRLQIPHTYLWSSALMTKPTDWGRHIAVAGFMTPSQSLDYQPPPDLLSFLQDGPAPVYIGFGSIVVDDAKELAAIILDAVSRAGVRAVVSQGWLRLPEMAKNSSIFLLVGDCPHGWLFEQVSCVVHHGGAGTTAAGFLAGKPTVVVPFFGDQFFWANAVARLGAGPQHIPAKELSAVKLANAIELALSSESCASARALSKILSAEKGSETAARSFHKSLPLDSLRCSIIDDKAAVWHHHHSGHKLSALAATVLIKSNTLKASDLKLSAACTYKLGHGPWDPISGGSVAITDLFYDVFKGIGEIGYDVVRLSQKVNDLGGGNDADANTTVFSDLPKRSHRRMDSMDKPVGYGTMKGSGRILRAAVRSPMTFSLGLAQGAHNAPLLWNDRTVRVQHNITGVGSGLLAGGKELFLGTYDGIAGLVLQPYIGARDGGILGGIKGIGKGIASFPTKWFAAMSGTVGYPLKGLDVAIQRLLPTKQGDDVIRARIIQGEQEYRDADEELRKMIAQRWISMSGSRSVEKEKSPKSVM